MAWELPLDVRSHRGSTLRLVTCGFGPSPGGLAVAYFLFGAFSWLGAD